MILCYGFDQYSMHYNPCKFVSATLTGPKNNHEIRGSNLINNTRALEELMYHDIGEYYK